MKTVRKEITVQTETVIRVRRGTATRCPSCGAPQTDEPKKGAQR